MHVYMCSCGLPSFLSAEHYCKCTCMCIFVVCVYMYMYMYIPPLNAHVCPLTHLLFSEWVYVHVV